jgi:heme oxygenase (biliverdin-IX-beta and delta-forming)
MTKPDDGASRFREPSAAVVSEAGEFLRTFRSLTMATVSADGVPDASYAPFVRIDDNAFYVNLSGLAAHTANLVSTPRASVLFLQSEDDSKQLFARKRLSFDVDAQVVGRDSSRWTQVMDLFAVKFGDVIDLIRPLEDFQLFRLAPLGAVFVRGFAQAYSIRGPGLEALRRFNDL